MLVDDGRLLEGTRVRRLGSQASPGPGRPFEGLQKKVLREDGLERWVEIGIGLHRLGIVGLDGPGEKADRLGLVAFLQIQVPEIDQVLGHVGVARAVDPEVDRERLAEAPAGPGVIALRPVGTRQAAVDYGRVPVALLRHRKLEVPRFFDKAIPRSSSPFLVKAKPRTL